MLKFVLKIRTMNCEEKSRQNSIILPVPALFQIASTMKYIILLFAFILNTTSTMGQNKHPMKIGMVSVFVNDPSKAFKYYTETLGFEEVMFSPENYIAIVKSPLDRNGVTLLLEPVEPGGLEIARKYKKELYEIGMPVISFFSDNIQKTFEELKQKGVKFKKDPISTDYGYEAIFDDANGNYIQLIQLHPEPIKVEVLLNTSKERLWKALTDVREMKMWFFDNIPDFEAKVGFKTQFKIGAEDRKLMARWEVTDVKKEERIKYNWSYEEFDGRGSVDFILSEKDGNILLTLINEGIESFPQELPEFSRESCIAGWQYFLQNRLKSYIEPRD